MTVEVQRWGDGWAVRCHDDCKADAWALHSGPWPDREEAERRAAKARPCPARWRA